MADSPSTGFGFFEEEEAQKPDEGSRLIQTENPETNKPEKIEQNTEAAALKRSAEESSDLTKSKQSDSQKVESDDQDNRFLVFRLGSNMFATPLLKTREVIEPVETSGVPNTRPYFTGVANIRGEVVGIIELKKKFGIQKNEDSSQDNPAVILFECETGTLGVTIDSVIGVESISQAEVETSPHIKSMIPQKYLLGIAKTPMGLITVVDLKKTLDDDDLVITRQISNG